MEISPTGDGLNILIACDYVPHHDWMSFLCWYSLSKNIPDAKVTVISHRRLMKYRLFEWSRKCGIRLLLHHPDINQEEYALTRGVEKPLLVLEPHTIAVRDLEQGNFPLSQLKDVSWGKDFSCDVKGDGENAFITYIDGWGKFVTSSWINRLGNPLTGDQRYGYGNLNANEFRLGRLWSAAAPLFQTVSRG